MEILDEQKLKYLSRRERELAQLLAAVGDDLFTLATDIGHKLKGNGKTFGFPLISEIGMQIESAGISKNKDLILDGIAKLQAEVKNQLERIN